MTARQIYGILYFYFGLKFHLTFYPFRLAFQCRSSSVHFAGIAACKRNEILISEHHSFIIPVSFLLLILDQSYLLLSSNYDLSFALYRQLARPTCSSQHGLAITFASFALPPPPTLFASAPSLGAPYHQILVSSHDSTGYGTRQDKIALLIMLGPFPESWEWIKAHSPGWLSKKHRLNFITIHCLSPQLFSLRPLFNILIISPYSHRSLHPVQHHRRINPTVSGRRFAIHRRTFLRQRIRHAKWSQYVGSLS